MDLVGRTLAGKYLVVRPLGQGGMGTVYEARDVILERRVALKTLDDDDARSVARFEQEAAVMAKVVHPNIAAVYDFQRAADAPPFLVMELVVGSSLATLLKREGALEVSRALRLASEILAALDAAHRAGVIHRDVKPANVLLAQDDVVKLVDFGIAKILTGGGVKTTTGAVLGTPAYLAPEQVFGGEVDARTDVYAVGLVLYEMITGRRMSREASPSFAGMPAHVASAITRATAKAKDDRFASAADLKAALAPPPPPPPPAPTPPVPPTSRRELLFAIALGTTLLVGSAIAIPLVQTKPPKPPPVLVVTPSAEPPLPEPSAEPETSAPVASSPPPSAVKTKAKCWCVNVLSNGNLGARICLQKEPPSCECIQPNGGRLCHELRADGSCIDTFAWSGKTGDECTGQVKGRPEWTGRGTMSCEYCYHRPMPPVRAVENAPCTGYEPGGKLVKGIFRCDD